MSKTDLLLRRSIDARAPMARDYDACGCRNERVLRSRHFAPRRIGGRLADAAYVAALHRVVSNRRFQRSPGLSSSPKT